MNIEDMDEDCGCGREGQSPHTCPFKEVIKDDDFTLCNCCEDCEEACKNSF